MAAATRTQMCLQSMKCSWSKQACTTPRISTLQSLTLLGPLPTNPTHVTLIHNSQLVSAFAHTPSLPPCLVHAGRYLSFDDMQKLATDSGFTVIPPLARTSLQGAMEHPVDFTTTVPAFLGLPPLPQTGGKASSTKAPPPNQAEGLVVRAAVEASKPATSSTSSSSTGKRRARCMMKRKAAAFAETRYHAALKHTKGEEVAGWGATFAGGSPYDMVGAAWQGMMTPQRLDAAISKVGPACSARAALLCCSNCGRCCLSLSLSGWAAGSVPQEAHKTAVVHSCG